MTLRDKLLSFDGRLRRRDWWLLGIGWGVLTTAVSEVAVRLIFGNDFSWFSIGAGGIEISRDGALAAYVTRDLITLALIWPQLALTAKRAQDRARAAWPAVAVTLALTLTATLDPYLAFLPFDILQSRTTALAVGIIYGLLSAGVGLWLLITLGFLDGTPGPNRFGPSPKGLSGGAPAFMAPGGVE